MIVNLHKYLIYGNRKEIDRFFFLAQKAGFLEFESQKKTLELPENAKLLLSAIKIAKHHEIHPEILPDFPADRLAESIIALQKEKENLLEEQRILSSEIARIAPLGHFSLEDIAWIQKEGNLVVQFFCMKSDLAEDFEIAPELIFVHSEYDLDYFVGIYEKRKHHPKMIEIFIDHSLRDLERKLERVTHDLSRIEKDLRFHCNGLSILQTGLDHCLNEYFLSVAKHDAKTAFNDSFFAIQAWVPKTKIESLFALISSLEVTCEEIAIEPFDRIPTYMENHGLPKVGEDLVQVYDTPSNTDKDPSMWILCFFALFFAMIISDAGYGIIYLIGSLYLKKKLGPNAQPLFKRLAKLSLVLSIATIIWGAATASFFGIEIGPDNPFRKISLLHTLAAKKAEYHFAMKDDVYHEYFEKFPALNTAVDGHDFLIKTEIEKEGIIRYEALQDFYDNILMELSLLIGVIHLSLSMLRYVFRIPTGFGWVLFMIGGYLYFPIYLQATSLLHIVGWVSKPVGAQVGWVLLMVGPAWVFIVALLERKGWMALHELTNGIQVFSDVLSYLRLYALALAGMVMANTFNVMGWNMGIFGVIIIVLGHIVNIGLSTMSAVIHGLRLNFLEWYRYSFAGEGKMFNPLRLRK
jgi:V/A-type H+-transporting ATPase subunit I